MSNPFSGLGNLKFFKDLGITGFIAIEVITGVLLIIIIALFKGLLSMDVLLPILGGWVGTVLGAYFTLKSAKQAQNGGKT